MTAEPVGSRALRQPRAALAQLGDAVRGAARGAARGRACAARLLPVPFRAGLRQPQRVEQARARARAGSAAPASAEWGPLPTRVAQRKPVTGWREHASPQHEAVVGACSVHVCRAALRCVIPCQSRVRLPPLPGCFPACSSSCIGAMLTRPAHMHAAGSCSRPALCATCHTSCEPYEALVGALPVCPEAHACTRHHHLPHLLAAPAV